MERFYSLLNFVQCCNRDAWQLQCMYKSKVTYTQNEHLLLFENKINDDDDNDAYDDEVLESEYKCSVVRV